MLVVLGFEPGDAIGMAVPPGDGIAVMPGDGIAVAAGDGIAVAAGEGIAVAAGDADAVAWAITEFPMFPRDASELDGAATALSPRLAAISVVRTPVLSRFKVAS